MFCFSGVRSEGCFSDRRSYSSVVLVRVVFGFRSVCIELGFRLGDYVIYRLN